jgi:hypothetical protein
MHYVIRRYHRLQKHKFGLRCPGAFFVKSVCVSLEQEKLCVDTTRPRRTTIHFMTYISHWMQHTRSA